MKSNNTFEIVKIVKQNFNSFSSRINMFHRKSKKPVENRYVVAPSPSLAATTQFDENFFPNSKIKIKKTNAKNDVCAHNTNKTKKKSKEPKPLDKDEKAFASPETFLEKYENTERLQNSFMGENEKDQDTEEFLGMIKSAVESAVEKSLQGIISHSLNDMNIKLDDISSKIIHNRDILERMQVELVNKIIHYGEENSRHFRYLCMKSEYDKMFYQHQNMISTIPVDVKTNVINPYKQNSMPPSEPLPETNSTRKSIQIFTNFSTKPHPTSLHNNFSDADNPQKSKFSVSSKSSDMGIEEVKELLEQLQKFYDKHSHEKDDQETETEQSTLIVPDQDVSADGDEDDESSDDSSSPSIEENIGTSRDA